jgi:hypothetical protein
VVTIAAMTARHTADLTLRRRESELSRTIVPAASVLAAALVLAVALPPASHAATSGKLQPATTVPATGSVPRRADDR